MRNLIIATILSSVSFGALANPWAVVCNGINEDGERVRVSDYRSEYQGRRLLIYSNLDRRDNSELNNIEGLVSDSSKVVRKLETFRAGKKIEVKVTYSRPSSQLPVDSDRNDELNGELSFLVRDGLQANSPILEESKVKVSCYRRTGGE